MSKGNVRKELVNLHNSSTIILSNSGHGLSSTINWTLFAGCRGIHLYNTSASEHVKGPSCHPLPHGPSSLNLKREPGFSQQIRSSRSMNFSLLPSKSRSDERLCRITKGIHSRAGLRTCKFQMATEIRHIGRMVGKRRMDCRRKKPCLRLGFVETILHILALPTNLESPISLHPTLRQSHKPKTILQAPWTAFANYYQRWLTGVTK
ncbi:hypothetical protein C8J56DRAFT_190770 [Mycena floridula]|nr:hypothetical protein C8J56DRAFT_190770 [Mycena floridula]